MKGLVFAEFISFMEEQYSPELADRVINTADLPNRGGYSRVGNYPHDQMLRLMGAMAHDTGEPLPALARAYGGYLFGRFVALFPSFFDHANDSFDFLTHLEDHVHTEVRKLHADACPPKLEAVCDGLTMRLSYSSHRPFADLAHGLIEASLAHFGDHAVLERVESPVGDGRQAIFHLRRKAAAA